MTWVHRSNVWIAQSPVGRYFRLDGSGHRKERKGSFFWTELRGGLATFFAMAYIISVNANIVSQTGGTCVCPPDSPDLCDSNDEYMLCVQEVNRDLVTATAAISALTSVSINLERRHGVLELTRESSFAWAFSQTCRLRLLRVGRFYSANISRRGGSLIARTCSRRSC